MFQFQQPHDRSPHNQTRQVNGLKKMRAVETHKLFKQQTSWHHLKFQQSPPQTPYTNVNLTSTPFPPTEPAEHIEHLMDAVAVQDREEDKATILTSDTPLPTTHWSKGVRNVETERSIQEIPTNANLPHLASRSSPTVSEESDGADTFVPIQASQETPNNGPESNHSTVSL